MEGGWFFFFVTTFQSSRFWWLTGSVSPMIGAMKHLMLQQPLDGFETIKAQSGGDFIFITLIRLRR